MADAPQVTYASPWLVSNQQSRQSALSPQREWEGALQVHHQGAHDSNTRRTILGLRRHNFAILCSLALILLGATVGGSVGGAAVVQKKSEVYVHPPQLRGALLVGGAEYETDTTHNRTCNPSRQGSNTSEESSTARPSLSASSNLPSLSAPLDVISSTVSSNANAAYTPRPPASVTKIDTSCPSDLILRSWTGDTYTCSPTTDINGKGDITGLVAYTVQACVDACSTLNRVQSAKTCVAVAVNQMLAGDYTKQGANCFLKNITGPTHPGNTGATFLVLNK